MAGTAIMCYDIKYNGGLYPTKKLINIRHFRGDCVLEEMTGRVKKVRDNT